MTALVTGGAGFIGSNLVRALIAEGEDVIVIDDLSTGRRERLPASPRLTLVEGDLVDIPDLGGLVARCDLVFHLAAQVGTMPSLADPVNDARRNVLATVRLLDACRGTRVRRVVCSASAAAFGEARADMIDEDHPQSPESFYALSKQAAERYARLSFELLGVPTVSLRYFNVYGLPLVPGEYAGVIVAFLDRLQRDLPLRIYGDGSQERDFVAVQDVVAANLLAARAGRNGGVYNIGTGVGTSVLQLAGIMSELAGRELRVDHEPARPGEVLRSVASIDRARRELGYAPAYDLRTGIAELWPSVFRAAG